MIKKPATAKLVTIVAVLAVAAAAALATKYHSASKVAAPAAAPPPPVSVVTASVQSHDVPLYLRGVGTVIAFNNVIVRSQITEQLVKIAFKQGQAVKKGDLLGEIDPSPYQAQLDQAIANRDRDQAPLENAKVDLDRYTKLVQQKSIATQIP